MGSAPQEIKLTRQRELGGAHPTSVLEVPGLGPAVERFQERRFFWTCSLAHGFHCRSQLLGVAPHAHRIFGFNVDDGLEEESH